MIFKLYIFLLILLTSCNLSYRTSKTDWFSNEVVEWSKENERHSTCRGWILYQGSDSSYHHFIGRVMDEWTWFNIKRSDMDLKDVRPVNTSSDGRLGYYYVDPQKEFIKVKEY